MYGKLVAVEGIDGVGKTTVCDRLAGELNGLGYNCIVFREPTKSSYWGIRVRAHLAGRLDLTAEERLTYFLLDRVFDVNYKIIPALKRGKIVIMDRYYYSTAAYQGSAEMFPSTIVTLSTRHLACPIPDVTVWLKTGAVKAYERIISRKGTPPDLFENMRELKRISMNYQAAFDSMSANEPIYEIDAEKDIETVIAEVLVKVKKHL